MVATMIRERCGYEAFATSDYRGEIIIVSGQDQTTLAIVQNAGEVLGLQRPHVHQKPLDFARLRETLTGTRLAKAG